MYFYQPLWHHTSYLSKAESLIEFKESLKIKVNINKTLAWAWSYQQKHPEKFSEFLSDF
jgi:hypothetical protein